ncbi:MAG: hypothetical protein Q8R82_18030 [Hyphomonadaceae bacterium]|nr:hypothetical protein [Hyphomonadaceae bacterium]
MGQTPTSSDRFARPAAPGATGIAIPGGRPDRFKEKAERAGGKKPVAKLDQPKTKPLTYDAFAAQKRPGATRQDPFARHKPQPRVAGFVPAVAAPALAETEVTRAPLHVVAAQPVVAKAAVQPAELKLEDVKREEVRRTRMGKSSSLVLVTGAAAELAEVDAPPRPAPATGDVPPVAPAAPAPAAAMPPLDMPAPKPRSGSGGGDGGGDGGKTVAPVRERSFTQDDLVGIVFGLAVIAMLLLWLMRGQEELAADDDAMVGTQFAATEPMAALTPPPAPLVDPFGDAAVDLKPTGPIPDPVAEDPLAGVVQSAPAPAAPVEAAPVAPAVAVPVAIADRTMHAWFCTAGSGLTKASKGALDRELSEFKSAFAGRELVVRGYADTRGTSVFNSALGGERANVVADFLRTNGLTVVDARGIGELDGLDDNQNCANQRRVDVYVKGGPGETPSRTCAPEPEVEELVCG